jgi:NAD(P)H dehydrogenase (quinone)
VLLVKGALQGKVSGAFVSSATQHGGQETTRFTIITKLLHFGMTVIGLNYGFAGQMKVDEITGGHLTARYRSPGPTRGGSRSRTSLPTPVQVCAIAETAAKLHG